MIRYSTKEIKKCYYTYMHIKNIEFRLFISIHADRSTLRKHFLQCTRAGSLLRAKFEIGDRSRGGFSISLAQS